MGVEIEKKFLVVNDSYRRLAYDSCRIAQGYLNKDPERTVRVRIKGDKGFLTVKGKNHGIQRLEFEYEIPLEDAEAMLDLCGGNIIEKERYYVRHEGFIWEVDEFKGNLEPLVVAEIELPSCDTSFPMPSFIGNDVTGDLRYYNSQLISN